MSSDLKRPIILFGNTRSGTTMVHDLLGLHPDVTNWYEPRYLWQYADPRRDHDEFEAADATDEVQRYIRRQFLIHQHRCGDRRIAEKTPVNVLRIPYVRTIFPEAAFLYIIRSPFSFISSAELKWQRPVSARGLPRRALATPPTQLPHYAGMFVRQQFEKRVLRRKYLSVWGARYREIADDLEREDILTVIARQWSRASAKAEHDLAAFDDGQVLRLRYEDFVMDPVEHLTSVYRHAGLEIVERDIVEACAAVRSDRQEKWDRFEPAQLARILPEVADEMRRHGYAVPEAISSAAAAGR